MKRKILFIISNLQTGGVSKSITSLLNVIDRERYDVSLMLVSPTGIFQELLPQGLRMITNPVWSSLTDRLGGFKRLLKLGHPLLAVGHLCRLAISCVNKAYAARMIAALMPVIDEEFDTIVDFNGQQQLYYMVDKLRAHKKVTFFHSDYDKWPYYYRADKKYFPQVDRIFTISDKCVESLRHYFPNVASKVTCMENINSLAMIQRMAEEPIEDFDRDKLSFLTIGHVCDSKGSHWAIEAADILRKRGFDFNWYFLGACENIDHYKGLVAKFHLENQIHFLGKRVNPYPYIRQAAIIVHPSQFEGKSIALDEARLLCKPVVVTNFSTVDDQFTDRYDASICEMTPKSIANAIEELLHDRTLLQDYIDNLRRDRKDNSSEIEKLYAIFDD